MKLFGLLIEILSSPAQFYQNLLDQIAQAEHTIYLASLYIGPSETGLLHALQDSLRRQPQLKLVVLVDYLRGTREQWPKPSGASTLAQLRAQFPDQVDVRMWRTPRYGGLFSLMGKRLNEGAGLQHMKLYACDDTVFVSGANLSADYFTNRQDRYVKISSHTPFATFVRNLIDRIASHAFVLTTVATQSQAETPYRLTWPAAQPERPSSTWARAAGQGLLDASRTAHTEMHLSPRRSDQDVSFTPLLQMGPYGVEQETTAVSIASDWLQYQDSSVPADPKPASLTRPKLYLTSGYFSVYPNLTTAIVNGTYPTSIIAASPQANGFFGSKGVSGYLPDGYTLLAYRFWQQLVQAGRAAIQGQPSRNEGKDNVVMYEWQRSGWTYHSKGLWLVPAGTQSPAHTFIGSSNFGGRSAHTDLECTLLLSAPNSSELRTKLAKEYEDLACNATQQFDGTLVDRQRGQLGRRVDSLFVRVATWLLRKNM